MDGCNVINAIIDNLGNDIAKTVNTVKALTSQGYLVNKCKLTRINTANMFIHAYENIDFLSNQQIHNINVMLDKFSIV